MTKTTKYEGIATGNIIATGEYGTVNQNAGFSQSKLYSDGKSAVIGKGGLLRAFDDGFTLNQVQEWVDRVGALVGPEAIAMGLRQSNLQ